MDRFGYRELTMPTVGLPPMRDKPEVVHSLIKGLTAGTRNQASSGGNRLKEARRQLAEIDGLRAQPLRPTILRLVTAARTGVSFREDSHYKILMAFAVARRIVLELGERLVAKGILQTAEDVVFLKRDELCTLSGTAAQERVARRKTARESALPGYSIIQHDSERDSENKVRGTPASRGNFTGRVRIIRSEVEFGRLLAGEVLVCPYTNPTWTPLFSLASAVVVDAGGAASHAAIVAREHGIPAVMGTGNGTEILVEGQYVTVDGRAGTVVKAP